MAIDGKIRDEKLQYYTNRNKLQKYQRYLQVKLINVNILWVSKNYFPIGVK